MQSAKSLNPAFHVDGDALTRRMVASNPVIALWRTDIGKKAVMAVTGVVLIGFVIAHMLGNLKIFSGPDEINAYSRFLREVGSPELQYGHLLWFVRIFLLVCLTLHITAAVQLTRMSWAARPVGYAAKRDIETSFAARTMRWGGVLLADSSSFILCTSAGCSRVQGGPVQAPARVPERGRRRSRYGLWQPSTSWRWARCACTSTTGSGARCRRSAGTPPGIPGHAQNPFAGRCHRSVCGFRVGSGCGDDRLGRLMERRSMLEARIPSGPIEQQWDKCRFEMKLVNPANRRKHTIIVVGAGLAGAAAAATLGPARLSRPMLFLSRHPSPRALHRGPGRD